MNRTDSALAWYSDTDGILSNLRLGQVRASSAPQLEDYGELRAIGHGGQGDVFVGTDQRLGRRVAIKVLRQSHWRSETAQRRFEREIEMVAGLQHAGIVRIYDSGVTGDGRPFFTMELIEGVPIDVYLDCRKHHFNAEVSQSEKLKLLLSILDAVGHAHQHGVIHRDLKSGNILIDGEGLPHILDFGLAAPVISRVQLTEPGGFVGTLAYAAPERLAGAAAVNDVGSDIYSLGALLYEMLTGRPVVPNDLPLDEAVTRIRNSEIAAPSASVQKVDGKRVEPIGRDLEAIVLKALEHDPARRYASAAAFRDDIQRYLEHEPVHARRPTGVYLLGKLIRRHRMMATAILAIVVALAASSVISMAAYRRVSVEAEKLRLTNVFLEDTLGSVSASSPGQPVLLKDVLHESIHWIDLALAEQPEVAASIRTTIGNSLRASGEYRRAEVELKQALDDRVRLFGPNHPDVAVSQNALALIYRDTGRFDDAETLFRTVRDTRMKLFGPRSLLVAQVTQNLGTLSLMRGNSDAALQYFTMARDIRREILGAEHPDVQMCEFQIAGALSTQGALVEAIAKHHAVLNNRLKKLSTGHPDIAKSELALGELYLQEADFDSAAAHFRAAYSLITENKGCDHWQARRAFDAALSALSLANRDDDADLLRAAHVEKCGS